MLVELSRSDLARGMWLAGNLQWKLDPLQRKISAVVANLPHARKICILSSRQIGKSYWCVNHTLENSIQRKIIARIIAPTLHNCHDIVNDNLMRICADAPESLIAKRRSEMRWEVSTSGSSIRLGALERAHVDAMNRGGNASLIIYEECGFVKGDDFLYGVNSVLGPQLLRSNGKEIFVSSPPEDPDHPLITQIKPECEELGTFFRFTVFDSPTITPEQIVEAAKRAGCVVTDSLRALILARQVNSENVHELADVTGSHLSEAFRREFLAEVVRPSTLMVVPDFSDTIRHVYAFDNPMQSKWTITIDWGGVRDKTCAILHTYDYLANMDLVRDEMVFPPNTATPVIAEALLARWPKEYLIQDWWADVPGQIQVDLERLGIRVNIPQKSDWLASVQAMGVKFTTNRIYIDPRCVFLRKSLRSGMFNKTRTDFDRSEELGHCDALAALMYGIRSQDRTNPYTDKPSNQLVTLNHTPSPELELAKAMNPKDFGVGRSFGNFKR